MWRSTGDVMLSLMRLPLAIAAVLSLSLTLCISIMRAMPYKTTDLLATFSPPDDCLRPCWAVHSARPDHDR